jgi:hypothetical protein
MQGHPVILREDHRITRCIGWIRIGAPKTEGRATSVGLPRIVALALAALLGAGGYASASGGDGSGQGDVAVLLARSAERLQDPTDFRTSEGAIAFAPDVTYPDAIRALHIAQTSGMADSSMEVVPSLPSGVVALIPDEVGERVVIDLAAPYGYDLAFPAALSPTYTSLEPLQVDGRQSDFGPWREGWRFVVPDLPSCMVLSHREDPPVPCTAADKVKATTSLPLP